MSAKKGRAAYTGRGDKHDGVVRADILSIQDVRKQCTERRCRCRCRRKRPEQRGAIPLHEYEVQTPSRERLTRGKTRRAADMCRRRRRHGARGWAAAGQRVCGASRAALYGLLRTSKAVAEGVRSATRDVPAFGAAGQVRTLIVGLGWSRLCALGLKAYANSILKIRCRLCIYE